MVAAVVGASLTVLLLAAYMALHAVDPVSMAENGVAAFFWPIPYLAFGLVGAVVAARRPRNAVGWLFLTAAILMSVTAATTAYAGYAFHTHTALPWADVASWLAAWTWAPSVGLLPAIFMLFPTGRPMSPRWRWPVVVTLSNAAAIAPASALLWAERGPALVDKGLMDWPLTDLLANRIAPGLLVVGLVSIGVRFRRSSGDERQQLKWLVFSASVLALMTVTLFAVPLERPNDHLLVNVVFLLGVSAVPLGAGVAILKYRLYEIDRLVNRTLVYGLVTSVLAGLYAGLVVLLQSLLHPLIRTSDLAVAASTLAVAAAFGPVRRWVQGFVDRRFNRARYDARKAVESLSHRLRDGVDLDEIRAALTSTATRTVQPSVAYLWLPEHRHPTVGPP